jgi:Protein of unknown function (DUF3052)
MAGYSGTPLFKKLGIKPGFRLYAENAPADYLNLLQPLPEGVTVAEHLDADVRLAHIFAREAKRLAARLAECRRVLADDAVVWVSWPKKAARVATDVTEDVIRESAFPLGLVDVKVCAVDETWSGLKLVVRVANRRPRAE